MGHFYCLDCSQKISLDDDFCPNCGRANDYKPRVGKPSWKGTHPAQRKKERLHFSDEEKLALGLYPKDEGYKMSLISRILGRK